MKLGRRGFLCEILPFLSYSSRIVGQKSRSFNLDRCLRDLELHSLKMLNWLTELLPLICIWNCLVEGSLRKSNHPSSDTDSMFIEHFDRNLVSLSKTANDIYSGILRSSKLSVQVLEARIPSFRFFLAT